MALIERGANHWIAAGAGAVLAGVGLRAGIAVVADRAIGLRLVFAFARNFVADARLMALIRWRAFNGFSAGANAAHADVSLRAGVVITACAAIDLGGI